MEKEAFKEDLVFNTTLIPFFSSREGNTENITAGTYLRDPAESCIPIECQHSNPLAV